MGRFFIGPYGLLGLAKNRTGVSKTTSYRSSLRRNFLFVVSAHCDTGQQFLSWKFGLKPPTDRTHRSQSLNPANDFKDGFLITAWSTGNLRGNGMYHGVQ